MTAERWKQATEEHELILNCLEARDGARLAEILKDHLKNKLETVKDWLISQEEGQV
jgi:DNA-binding GntR family transcriptional regulator